jgi:hypothetical protein
VHLPKLCTAADMFFYNARVHDTNPNLLLQ